MRSASRWRVYREPGTGSRYNSCAGCAAVQDTLPGALGDDPAVFHQQDVGDALWYLVLAGRRHNDAHAVAQLALHQVLHDLKQAGLETSIQSGQGIVEDQQLGAPHQRPGDRHFASFSIRELNDLFWQELLDVQQLDHPLPLCNERLVAAVLCSVHNLVGVDAPDAGLGEIT